MPQKLYCEVIDLVNHGEHVYSIFLKPNSPAPRFLAGQFLHLALDAYNPGDFWPESRAFSIASSPADRNLLAITYAVKGKFTTRMEAELCIGRLVWVNLPFGEFTVNTKEDACLIAGGTGITAYTAFLSELTASYPHRIYLFYGARKPELLIYRPLAEAAGERCPNLHTYFFSELIDGPTDCLPGQIDPKYVWDASPQPLKATFYIAGPPEMIRYFIQRLRQYGVLSSRIVTDLWE